MAYLLPHLTNGWEVDQAILNEEDRVVVIRFGRDNDPNCMIQDEVRQFWFPNQPSLVTFTGFLRQSKFF
jgi:hypothetical protein